MLWYKSIPSISLLYNAGFKFVKLQLVFVFTCLWNTSVLINVKDKRGMNYLPSYQNGNKNWKISVFLFDSTKPGLE